MRIEEMIKEMERCRMLILEIEEEYERLINKTDRTEKENAQLELLMHLKAKGGLI